MIDPKVQADRDLALVAQSTFEFQGKRVGPYTAAHRAILRTLFRGHDKIPFDILAWMMMFVMMTPSEKLVELAFDEAFTFEMFSLKVLEFAGGFPALANIECLKIVGSILSQINSVTAKMTEKKTNRKTRSKTIAPSQAGLPPTESK